MSSLFAQIVSGAHPCALAIHHRQCVPQAGSDSPGPEPTLCTHQRTVRSAGGLSPRGLSAGGRLFPIIRPTTAVLMITKPRAVGGEVKSSGDRQHVTVLFQIGQLHQNLGVQKPRLHQHVCPAEERAKGLEVSLQEAPRQP